MLQFTTKQKDNFSNIWKTSTNQKQKMNNPVEIWAMSMKSFY